MEFLLLVMPLVGLASTTAGVVWYAFAKAQLTQVAAEGAMMAAEPDSSSSEVLASVGENLRQRLGASTFSMNTNLNNGVLSFSIELPVIEFVGPMAMVFPELSAVSNVPVEIQS